jgi:hypothetical protein
MNQPCSLCCTLPVGVEGHEGLYLVFPALPPDPHRGPYDIFVCAKCQRRWGRAYGGGGTFLWVAIASDA